MQPIKHKQFNAKMAKKLLKIKSLKEIFMKNLSLNRISAMCITAQKKLDKFNVCEVLMSQTAETGSDTEFSTLANETSSSFSC